MPMRHYLLVVFPRCAYYVCGAFAWCIALIILSSCASRHIPPDPTPDRPRLACIADSPLAPLQQSKYGGGRLLPEIVRVIGVTPPEDGERWMIVRGAYIKSNCTGANLYDRAKCDWQPFDREAIQFHGCGPEMPALMQLGSTSE